MSAPLISVIISNFNYGHFLSQAIDSVLRQSYLNLELIVVDDGSSDDSEAVARRYGDRVRWFRQQNQGVSAARNRGIQESRGELVAFLDADDIWHPEKLARQLEVLRDPEIGMVYCGLQYIDADGQSLGTSISGACGRVLKEIALLRGPGVPTAGSSGLLRKQVFERVGLFDVKLSTSADWDLNRRIACHYKIGMVREALVSYRLHPLGMHHNVDLLEKDMLRAFSNMFDDVAAMQVFPYRHRCYSNLYLMLSGSYLYGGQLKNSIRYASWAITAWPPNVFYLASFPIRLARRRLNAWMRGLKAEWEVV